MEKRLKPEVTNIEHTSQGNCEVNSNWAIARYDWALRQLLIQLGGVTNELDVKQLYGTTPP